MIARQLAAVMFTDIVGYTALMQADEARASTQRNRHRKVFEEQHTRFNGDIVQYYGDGTLSVFKSAVQAASCAMEIQRLLQLGDSVPLRIGLHMGDIVFDQTEVYGDGVNLASRIESLSVAGAVLLSDKINDELRNQNDITTSSLGQFNLKNVQRPVEVFAITNAGLIVPEKSEVSGKGKQVLQTIAVLPFVNMSPSEENEYFSDGITEEIINALAKIKQLKVTSRTSSFFFKGKHVPIKQIGQELNVSVILEGSVRRVGDTVRVNAQLIEAEQDYHFWSETWDRTLENIFEIQDEISLSIADKLREQFGHLEIQDHLVSKQTDSVQAYEFFLKGRYHSRKWNPKDVEESINFYNRALELDSRHAESYLGLADAFGFLATTGFMPIEEAWGKAIAMTSKAREINEDHDGVHFQLANQAFFIAGDFGTALEHTLKSVSLNSNNAEALQFLSFLYIVGGDEQRARAELEKAMIINPLSQETLFFKAYFQYMTGDYSGSLTQLDSCLKDNPKNLPAHVIKCYVLLKMGRANEVIDYFDQVPEEIVVQHDKLGLTALAYAYLHEEAKAEEYLEQLKSEAKEPNGFRAHSYLLLMHVAMGKLDLAFEWIDQAVNDGFSLILFHYTDPLVHALKTDPRYAGYFNRLYPQAEVVKGQRKKKALLEEETVPQYIERLLEHVRSEEPYLDQELSLRSLAAQVELHPNQLSWLLNERLNKNFNEFVNHYRVQAFKKLALDPANAQVTLLGLAYDSGFSSKTVFNTYFKKETGRTPKQFLNEQQE